MWYGERIGKSRKQSDPNFTMCCKKGKIVLPAFRDPPFELFGLLVKDEALNGKIPKFLQLYIYDTPNEISNGINSYGATGADVSSLKENIVRLLKNLLDEHNPHVKAFRQARDRIDEDGGEHFKLRLIDGRSSDGRTHNLPTADKVAALIPGDFVMNMEKRDIIVEIKTCRLQRISELHPSYLPLQYPLLFPYGEDGFCLDIPIGLQNTSGRSGRLFQQFLVDAYTMIESNRLRYVWFNQKKIRCNDFESITKASEAGVETLSEQGWFEACKMYEETRDITYAEMPTRFTWNRKERVWKPRKRPFAKPRKRSFAVGRIAHIGNKIEELYYLRILLNYVKGPQSFEDIRTVESVTYETFKEAYKVLGLFDDDKEYILGIEEASNRSSGYYLRRFFVIMLISDCLTEPELVWNLTLEHLTEDILYQQKKKHNNLALTLTEDQLKNIALTKIQRLLQTSGRSLSDWDKMPKPDDYKSYDGNRLVDDELRYDQEEQRKEQQRLLTVITDEQRAVYEEILDDVIHDKGGVFFLSGFGGTGKTFIWSILFAAIRGLGKIVINTASSWIAALLLEGGRTAHSRFNIPMNPDETTSCKISPYSDLAKVYGGSADGVSDKESFFRKRAILCPTNEDVDQINDYILTGVRGQEMVYHSSDSIDPTDVDPSKVVEYPVEFLNSIKISGLPKHELKLKVGAVVMCMHNLDPPNGLCNRTMLMITNLSHHVIRAVIMTGSALHIGNKTMLLRMYVTPSDGRFPFRMRRRQFPVTLAWPITIIKARLYVALSQEKSRSGLKILITDEKGNVYKTTTNVVYKEIFDDIH
ncbi:hypothetical protein Bca101_020459 [Brassica carinata]